MADTPPRGVSGDVSRDDGSSSRVVVEGFFSPGVTLPAAFGLNGPGTFVKAYYTGSGAFTVIFGDAARSTFELWTTAEGFDAFVDELVAHRDRAREARA